MPSQPSTLPNAPSVATTDFQSDKIQSFANAVKQKHPEYKEVDNNALTTAMLKKYPEYKSYFNQSQPSTATQTPDTGIGEKLMGRVSWAGESIGNVLSGKQSLTSGLLQTGGAVAGGINDIIGSAISSWYEAAGSPGKDLISHAAKSIFDTDLGRQAFGAIQQGTEAYDKWKTENPVAAKNLESIVNIASLLPTTKASEVAADITKWAVSKAWTTVKNLIKTETPEIAELAKPTKKVLDYITPKEFTPTEKMDLVSSGKLKTGKWLTWEWFEYVPDKFDIEIAKDATPFIDISKPSSTNVANLRKGIEKESLSLESAIKENNPIIPNKRVQSYIKWITDSVMDNPEMVGDNKKIAQKLLNKFAAMQKEEGGSGLGVLNARKRFDEYVSSVKPKALWSTTGNVYDTIVRTIRNWANDFVDSVVSNVEVKKSLRKQRNLYKAIDLVSKRKDISKLWKIIKNPIIKTTAAWLVGWTAAAGIFGK